MAYAGIDQSLTGTGVVILDNNGSLLSHMLVDPKKLRGVERLAYISLTVGDLLRHHNVTGAMMEGYSYDSVHRGMDLAELGGVLKLMLYTNKMSFKTPSPSQVKKFATGKGQATKERVMEAVEKNWGVKILDDNIADAFVLAKIAYVNATKNTVKRNELEVVMSLNKPEEISLAKVKNR